MAVGYLDEMSSTNRTVCIRRAETFCRAVRVKINSPYRGSCQGSEGLRNGLHRSGSVGVCLRLLSIVSSSVHRWAERNLSRREGLLHHVVGLRIDNCGG